jgi:glutamine synthetase adenylyltransferase
VSSLPADPTEQRKLAIGMKFKDREAWQEQCERARADIHGIYDKYFRSTSQQT